MYNLLYSKEETLLERKKTSIPSVISFSPLFPLPNPPRPPHSPLSYQLQSDNIAFFSPFQHFAVLNSLGPKRVCETDDDWWCRSAFQFHHQPSLIFGTSFWFAMSLTTPSHFSTHDRNFSFFRSFYLSSNVSTSFWGGRGVHGRMGVSGHRPVMSIM